MVSATSASLYRSLGDLPSVGARTPGAKPLVRGPGGRSSLKAESISSIGTPIFACHLKIFYFFKEFFLICFSNQRPIN